MIIEIAGGEGQNYESRELLQSVKDLDDAVVSVREDVEDIKDNVVELSDELDNVNTSLDELAYGDNNGGKNYLNYNNIVGGILTDNTFSVNNYNPTIIKTLIVELPKGDYVLSTSKPIVALRRVVNGTFSDITTGSITSYGFSTNGGKVGISFRDATSGTTEWTYRDMQIEKGSSATDYEPFIMSNKQLTEANASLDDYGLNNQSIDVEQGYIASNGVLQDSSNAVRSKYSLSCKAGDVIKMKYDGQFGDLYIRFYNSAGTYLSSAHVTSGELLAEAPANATTFKYTIVLSSGITPNSTAHVGIYINNAIDELKADLHNPSVTKTPSDIFKTIADSVTINEIAISELGYIGVINAMITVTQPIYSYSTFLEFNEKFRPKSDSIRFASKNGVQINMYNTGLVQSSSGLATGDVIYINIAYKIK